MKKQVDKMTNGDYHADPAIGSTTLKYAIKSMATFKAAIDGKIKGPKTTALDVGTAAHSAILEKDLTCFVEGPDVSKATKIWKEFVKENEGKIVLKPEEYNAIKGMYEAFFAHPIASKLIANGKPEQSFFCEIDGQEFKARTDWMNVDDKKGDYVVDYKTAASASPDDFMRSVYRYRYDLSAAHYMKVVSEVTGRKVEDFIWIVQEKTAPYEISIFRASDDMLDRAVKRRDSLYAKIKSSKETKEYPGMCGEIKELDLSHWDSKKEEEALDE